jgi:hypothetical protein
MQTKSELTLEDYIAEIFLWIDNECPLLEEEDKTYPLILKEVSDFYGKDARQDRLCLMGFSLIMLRRSYDQSNKNLESLAELVVKLKG